MVKNSKLSMDVDLHIQNKIKRILEMLIFTFTIFALIKLKKI